MSQQHVLSQFDNFFKSLKTTLNDESFQKTVSGDVLGPIDDPKTQESVVLAALRCIVGGPQGVRKMTETAGLNHIKNNKNWRPFCQQLLVYLKQKNMLKDAESFSSTFTSFGKFWPECDEELQKAVEAANL